MRLLPRTEVGTLKSGVKYLIVHGGPRMIAYLPGLSDCFSDVAQRPVGRIMAGLPWIQSHSVLLISRRIFPDGNFSLESYADDTLEAVATVCRNSSHDTIDLAGMSFGGAVALMIAPQLPVRLRTLSVQCAGTSLTPEGQRLLRDLRPLLEQNRFPELMRLFSRGMFRKRFTRLIYQLSVGIGLSPQFSPVVRSNLMRIIDLLSHWDGARRLADVPAPVQFIRGEFDDVFTTNTEFAASPCIIESIPGTAHAARLEANWSFNRTYLRFLRAHP